MSRKNLVDFVREVDRLESITALLYEEVKNAREHCPLYTIFPLFPQVDQTVVQFFEETALVVVYALKRELKKGITLGLDQTAVKISYNKRDIIFSEYIQGVCQKWKEILTLE